MAELSKYFLNSEITDINRSQIHFHPRNPRTIDDQGKKALKRSMKNFGILGGIIVNKRNNYVIVGGNQKVALMDDAQGYDPNKPEENDYVLRVEVVDFDDKKELEALTALNNPTIGGKFDWQKLAELIPDMDYKNAGLTEEDLSMIGVDYLFQTEGENSLSTEIDDLMQPVIEEHQRDLERQREQREAIKEAQREANVQQDAQIEKTAEEKKQHMKDVKEQVKTQAIERAMDQEAYVMLSFDNFQAKREFMQRAGYPEELKFIKAEEFTSRIEFID